MDKDRVVVGEIENLTNWVYRVLPIQSLRQVVFVVVTAGAISLGFFAIFKAAPPAVVIAGMLLGMHPFLAGVLPTRFQIDVGGNGLMKRELMENLEAAAFRFGYKEPKRGGWRRDHETEAAESPRMG